MKALLAAVFIVFLVWPALAGESYATYRAACYPYAEGRALLISQGYQPVISGITTNKQVGRVWLDIDFSWVWAVEDNDDDLCITARGSNAFFKKPNWTGEVNDHAENE